MIGTLVVLDETMEVRDLVRVTGFPKNRDYCTIFDNKMQRGVCLFQSKVCTR